MPTTPPTTPVCLRNGREAQLICPECPEWSAPEGWMYVGTVAGELHLWREDGAWREDGREHPMDIQRAELPLQTA